MESEILRFQKEIQKAADEEFKQREWRWKKKMKNIGRSMDSLNQSGAESSEDSNSKFKSTIKESGAESSEDSNSKFKSTIKESGAESEDSNSNFKFANPNVRPLNNRSGMYSNYPLRDSTSLPKKDSDKTRSCQDLVSNLKPISNSKTENSGPPPPLPPKLSSSESDNNENNQVPPTLPPKKKVSIAEQEVEIISSHSYDDEEGLSSDDVMTNDEDLTSDVTNCSDRKNEDEQEEYDSGDSLATLPSVKELASRFVPKQSPKPIPRHTTPKVNC